MPYPRQPPRREREYPPTPYPPHSAATATYRNAYDLGVRHFGTMSWDIISRYAAGLAPGSPDLRGYRDGVTAAWRRAQKAKLVDPEIIRRERAESDEQRRRAAQNERPY